jgi:HSP20 family protein
VYVGDEKVSVIKYEGGKRKNEGVEDEECCNYIQMERKINPKFVRKFTLPGDDNVEGIFISCVDGVFTVIVPRILFAMKSKTIHIYVN